MCPADWSNLAGYPARHSKAIEPRGRKDRRQHSGLIKLRLGHSAGKSYLIPDVLIGVRSTRYFLPSFFGPPWIAFNVEDGKHTARLSMDVGPPKSPSLDRLLVTVHSTDHILSYEDGAQLYRCTFEGPRTIARFASGLCHALPDGDFALEVYHHTKPDSAGMIRASRELWSSPWNLAGTRQLTNAAYAYFTSLSRIGTEEDLRQIAMASDGEIRLQTTSDRSREEVLTLKVYRGNTTGRTASMLFTVPCRIVSPAHLYLHPNVGTNPAYYEVVGSEIIRVGVNPKSHLAIAGNAVDPSRTNLKRFDYVVLGDASTVTGLAAPYEEEETKEVTHLERLDEGLDMFEFWLKNQNTDQVSGRTFEARTLK